MSDVNKMSVRDVNDTHPFASTKVSGPPPAVEVNPLSAELEKVKKEVAKLDAMVEKLVTAKAKLQKFLMENYKNETGNETPEDCAIRLLSKKKTSK